MLTWYFNHYTETETVKKMVAMLLTRFGIFIWASALVSCPPCCVFLRQKPPKINMVLGWKGGMLINQLMLVWLAICLKLYATQIQTYQLFMLCPIWSGKLEIRNSPTESRSQVESPTQKVGAPPTLIRQLGWQQRTWVKLLNHGLIFLAMS